MSCLQQAVSSINQLTTSNRAAGAALRQPGRGVEFSVQQTMDSDLDRKPKFVEHLVVATVAEFIEGEIIQNLVNDLNSAMDLPGVLAADIGRCEPMLGEHTFMIHIRAVDTTSCDAAYSAVSEVYGKHLVAHTINRAEDFGDIIVVDFNSIVIGAADDCFAVKWPAIRIAIFEYKPETPEEKKEGLIQVLSLLPTLFPSVKQVSWGRNIAKERTYREHYGYADVDHELGVILGFDSCQDMYALGADPKYWELLNFHGISLLEKYQVLTLTTS